MKHSKVANALLSVIVLAAFDDNAYVNAREEFSQVSRRDERNPRCSLQNLFGAKAPFAS